MTLSNSEREGAVATALCRMLEDIGEVGIDGSRFEIRSDKYADLPRTTWLELEALEFVKSLGIFGSPTYRLTASGWIAALKQTGAFDSQELQERAARLRAALKDVVKGRELRGSLTSLEELHGKTELPCEWILHALQSRLLQLLWLDDHMDVDLRHGRRSIRVPGRFGSRRLFGLQAGPFPDP